MSVNINVKARLILKFVQTNRYSEFTMAPNYFSSAINIAGVTQSFRSNERDDDSADSGKGGSEDDIGLANLQYGMDYIDPTNKGTNLNDSFSPLTYFLLDC